VIRPNLLGAKLYNKYERRKLKPTIEDQVITMQVKTTNAYRLGKLFLQLGLGLFFCLIYTLQAQSAAFAESPIAVIFSETNKNAYEGQHIGDFNDDWAVFKRTLESTNVRYDLLGDKDIASNPQKLQAYKLIVFPYLVDLQPTAVFTLTEYLKNGGKLLVTDSGGMPAQNGQALLLLAGVNVTNHLTIPDVRQLNWQKTPLPIEEAFAIGTLMSDVSLTNGGNAIANWTDGASNVFGPAIVRRNGSIYLSWAPGLQGEISTNSSLLSESMEELVPTITQQAAIQISYADYQVIKQELEYLEKRTDETIKTAKQADLAVPFQTITQAFESAKSHVKIFDEAYHARRYFQADEELKMARHDFAMAFAEAMPVRPVEARCIWLDRGTIVSVHNAVGMTELFDRLAKANINVVYFETNNSGFTMYPSKIASQNPEMLGWDPLGCAIKEAHKHGMELHAWFWIFNVGNVRHNPIIGREPDYPGPVLSSHDFAWALAAKNGSLMAHNGHEFFIDPSVPEARQYAKDLVAEVVTNYPVDGVQLDYIRYPFNGKSREMGYNWLGRMRFENETGLNLDKLDEETRQVWQAWKIAQVTNFVKDVSTSLKRLKPGLRISGAVYGQPLRWRLNLVQQEWETWVKNGWLDTVNPMTYVATPKELSFMAKECRESSQDLALVYPAMKIMQLDPASLIEQLDTSREIGTLGTTIFAAAHLDDRKLDVLKAGPYRRKTIMTPQSDPLKASRILMDDFASMVNRYLQDPQKHILSDQASTNEVLDQIDMIQQKLHSLDEHSEASQIAEVNEQVKNLHKLVSEWLRLEAFIQRGYRAQYIVSYLGQMEAILTYASHRAQADAKMLAGAASSEQIGDGH
jgi:uncharacterized lipoprotein YddW (UPF0748 family)